MDGSAQLVSIFLLLETSKKQEPAIPTSHIAITHECTKDIFSVGIPQEESIKIIQGYVMIVERLRA
jgi:hypothetical protein